MYVLPLRLPSISLLNGSVVTDSEREDAERFCIRYYLDYPEEELPYRYTALSIYDGRSVFVTYMCVCAVKPDSTTCPFPPQIPFPGDQVWETGTTR